MSNKTTLQTNNNELNANNTDLASILNTINNLPEAGGTTEDLSSELTNIDSAISAQETTIDDIIIALQGKTAGGSGGGSSEGWSKEVANVNLIINSESSDVIPAIYYTCYYVTDSYSETCTVDKQLTNLNYNETISVMKNTVLHIIAPGIMDIIEVSDYTSNIELATYSYDGEEFVFDSYEGALPILIKGDATLVIDVKSNEWGLGGM